MAKLTGRRRYRRTWLGKMVLQVEEVRHHIGDLNGSGYYDEWDVTIWRDAKWYEVYGESS